MYAEIITAIEKFGYPIAVSAITLIYMGKREAKSKEEYDDKINRLIEAEHRNKNEVVAVEREKTELFKKQFESEKKDKQKLYENLSKMSDAFDGFVNVFKDTYSKLDNRVQNVEIKVDDLIDVVEDVLDVKNGK